MVEKHLPKTINLKLFLVVVIQLYRLFPRKAEKHKRMNKILKEFLLCGCEFLTHVIYFSIPSELESKYFFEYINVKNKIQI